MTLHPIAVRLFGSAGCAWSLMRLTKAESGGFGPMAYAQVGHDHKVVTILGPSGASPGFDAVWTESREDS